MGSSRTEPNPKSHQGKVLFMSRGCAVLLQAETIRLVDSWEWQQPRLRQGPTQNPRYPKTRTHFNVCVMKEGFGRVVRVNASCLLVTIGLWSNVCCEQLLRVYMSSVNSCFEFPFEKMNSLHRSFGADSFVGRSIHFWGTWFFVSFHCLSWGLASLASRGMAGSWSRPIVNYVVY